MVAPWPMRCSTRGAEGSGLKKSEGRRQARGGPHSEPTCRSVVRGCGSIDNPVESPGILSQSQAAEAQQLALYVTSGANHVKRVQPSDLRLVNFSLLRMGLINAPDLRRVDLVESSDFRHVHFGLLGIGVSNAPKLRRVDLVESSDFRQVEFNLLR